MIVSGPPTCDSVASIRKMTPKSPTSLTAARRAPAVNSTAVAPCSLARRSRPAGSCVPGCGPK